MPLTLLDLEKVNQMMNQNQNQNQQLPQHLYQQSQSQTGNFADLVPNNMNYLLNNNITKNHNLITSALMHQFQQSQTNLNSKLFSNNLILNCIQANAQLLSSQNSENQKQINYSRYKTELCRQFIENGECKYGDKCQFAHGMPDMKDVNRHPKYKTDYCKTFHSKGFCPYGPRCHFIHELHEKFDPSIQNVSTSKKPKASEVTKPVEDTQIIDKQLEAIQAQLASTLFVSEDSNDNFTINDSKNQLADSGCEKQNNVQTENSNSSFSSDTSSPVTSSILSNSASSYTSTSNSASVSSSTSPVNRLIKKPTFPENNFYNKNISQQQQPSTFDCTIKNIFDGIPVGDRSPRSISPMTAPRTRSSTSSTSSACSSTSSFDFNLGEETHNANVDTFSPIKQQKQTQQQIQRATFNAPSIQKNLGPIGRPPVQSNVVYNTSNNSQNLFDIDRINNLLMQSTFENKSKYPGFNKNILADNTNQKSFFPPSSEFNSFGNQVYHNSLERHSGW